MCIVMFIFGSTLLYFVFMYCIYSGRANLSDSLLDSFILAQSDSSVGSWKLEVALFGFPSDWLESV